MNRPGFMVALMVIITLLFGSLVTQVRVDTDPENMLSKQAPVRLFHNKTKKEFALHDVVVVGVVNQHDTNGVFNPETLSKIYTLSRFAANLSVPDTRGGKVIGRDIVAPDNVDTIEQAGLGQVQFQWLMKKPPRTLEEALKIRDQALSNPLLKGTMVSEDGRALALYLPISKKDFAHKLSEALKAQIKTLDTGNDHFYISGLPVAEDTFGKEMFTQMAISVPLAMLVIFLLMLFFFKKIQLIIAPMVIAVCTVISTMGLFIGSGNTLHIMSSMIPIFIMPVAVVDSIHILSEFFDVYQKIQDRRKAIEQVMHHLFTPMLFTSLTSSAGFTSLALTPIPPVRVFGIFVAIGIMLAWLLTILIIPAYIMLIKEKHCTAIGMVKSGDLDTDTSIINRHLRWIGKTSCRNPLMVLGCNLLVVIIGVAGILMIQVNDNPVKWFKKSHEIRVADRVLNTHFGGTYEAYLVLSGTTDIQTSAEEAKWLGEKLNDSLRTYPVIREKILSELSEATAVHMALEKMTQNLSLSWQEEIDNLETGDNDGYDGWTIALDTLDQLRNQKQIFKRPDLLNYIIGLQNFLKQQGDVGKSNSIADVVQKVHQELFEGDSRHYSIPKTANGVAQALISYQNAHKPDDLWHLITPDYTRTNIWLQLKSGDNRDMERVVADVEDYLSSTPPPVNLQVQWAGLTYINVAWQNKMVTGMLKSFLSSFIVVFLMMTLLFRSPVWGILAMIPLSFTIIVIYGIIGLTGKDYDMPVAVLSSLTLGLAVDFAIHFLQRSRATMANLGDWTASAKKMFAEPARAIVRNTIVITLGFTPLLFSPLIPYKTVGVILAAIMLYSSLATLWILPALLTLFQGWIFTKEIQETTTKTDR